MVITLLIGGPLSGQRRAFAGDTLEATVTRIHQPQTDGRICAITRTGQYRKYALVPTVAMWTW